MTGSSTSNLVLGNGSGKQIQIAFTTSEDISAFSISPARLLASRTDIHNLIAGAIVFRHTAGTAQGTARFETLLLQRAPSDSFPLRWEIPAGTADQRLDATIFGLAVRELWEETGLRANRLVGAVGLGLANGVTNITMHGEADDAKMDSEFNMCLIRVSGLTWAIVTFIAEVDGNEDVVLQPDEHVAWAWVGEDEVKTGRFRQGKDENIEFVSDAMRMLVLEGFKLWKVMAEE